MQDSPITFYQNSASVFFIIGEKLNSSIRFVTMQASRSTFILDKVTS